MCKPLLPLYDEVFQEKFNAKALGMFSVDGIALLSTKPVRTLGDWKGLLVGTGSPMTSAIFKELGASPVTTNWTDLYESLQRHVIDATAFTPHGALSMNLMDVCDHIAPFYAHGAFHGFTINLDVWKKMPENIQKILQEEIDTSCRWMDDIIVSLQDDDVKAFKQKGTKIIVIPNVERERWAERLAPLKEKQLSSLGEFGQEVQEIAEEANQRYPYDEKKIRTE